MKVHKPVKLFILTSVLDVINVEVKRNKESYIYIIDYILTKPLRNKRNKDINEAEFVSINKQKIEFVIGCNSYNYIKHLEKYELIERDGNYKNAKKSFHYRIYKKYYVDLMPYNLKPDSRIFIIIIKQGNNEKTNYSKLEPHLYQSREK
ncbi:MAG: hypothetical protein GQ564_05395 [Bacteroidales bacterium]|nr:hypothetical protein [Bacteroidales bacterium]